MAVKVVVQRAADQYPAPEDEAFQRWAEAGLQSPDQSTELTIRIVDEAEGRRLNADYRDRDKATNVLSFPPGLPDEVLGQLKAAFDAQPLGDLVLCAPVIIREAGEQGKPALDHWAHLVVHGILHLLGHDHEHEDEARIMEQTETAILAGLGIPDPYQAR